NWWPFGRRRSSGAAENGAPRGPSLLTRVFGALPSLPRIGLETDAERQEVRFRLSYTAAVVAGFTIVVAMVLSFMIGRHGARAATPALADRTTEELRAGPAQPEVLDVHAAGETTGAAPMAMASENVSSASGAQPAAAKQGASPATAA